MIADPHCLPYPSANRETALNSPTAVQKKQEAGLKEYSFTEHAAFSLLSPASQLVVTTVKVSDTTVKEEMNISTPNTHLTWTPHV